MAANIFDRIKNFYRGKSPRERIMLLCVILAALGVWYTVLSKKSAALSDEYGNLSKRELVANVAIDNAPQIREELERIKKAFGKSKTLDASALQIAAEDCAKKAGLVCTLSASSTRDAGKFKINSINLTALKASLKACADFENEIRVREPYMAITKAAFDGNGKGAVNARYVISSFSF